MPQKSLYEFGPFRLDIALNRLQQEGEAIPLPPKAFDLLVLLARNADRVVTKSELMESLWPKTFVEDANLTQHVYTLRKALGDQPGGQPYIETIPRRGYRLATDVREIQADERAGSTAAALPGRSAIPEEAERKLATVMCCSISNAAVIAERLGSAEMHDRTRRLLDLAAAEVSRYEGVIAQRQSDGFVAIFGAPVVHEDDARRAVLAAVGIQRAGAAPNPVGGPDDPGVDLQIGISTGPLIVSRVADDRRVDYVPVGETVRVADVLKQFAEPGAILIGEATRRAVEKHLHVEPVEPVAGTRAYRIAAGPDGLWTKRMPARVLTPFVGRQRELALLDGLLAQAFAGQGQVVSIVGEPGMGKSRLGYEFTTPLRERTESVTVLEGRCVSYGSMIPYLPLSDLVRVYCDVDERDSPETVRCAIERMARETGWPSDAALWLLRLLGVADGAAALEMLSPEAVKARTFDVLRLLFLKAAARRPLVIVVEDTHWIDRTSEEFLGTLVERLIGARVLIIATCRPGYRTPWMERSYASQITLSPLGNEDSAHLVESIARDRPIAPEVSDAILRRGEGNPFFLEELTHSVGDPSAAGDAIPATVHGVIMARLDRLLPATKQLLQTCSVIGREVSRRLLAQVWEGAAEIDGELNELCRLEFLYERTAGDEPSNVFKHALTQDVAYDSMLARRRRELHLRVARALESLHESRTDDVAATLAYHYVRTDLVDEAVTWLMRAADQAARVYANAEAIQHLDLAARRLQRLPEGADRDRRMLQVALRHAHSLYFLGQFRESIAVLQPHEARLARLNDPALGAAYSFWQAHMYSRLGDQRRAAESAHRAIAAGTTAGDEVTVGKAHGLLALEGHWAGRPEDGIAHGAKAVTRLKRHPDHRWWLGMAHFYIAMNQLLSGDFEAALEESSNADAVGREIGDPRLQTYAAFTAGWVEATRGNYDTAVALCQRSREQAPDRVSRVYATLVLAFALVEKGDYESAAPLLEPVIAELEAFGFPQWHSLTLTLLGETLRAKGCLEESAARVNRGLQVATQAQYWYSVGFAQRANARILRDRGLRAEARAALNDAVQTFERIHARFESERTRQELEGS